MKAPLEQAISILSDLVSFDTTSHRSNLPMVDYLQDRLQALGCRVERIPNAEGTKAGILAGFGPTDQPGLLLSAHTDVVPASSDDWSHDPFTLNAVGNRLIGRGVCDMKGFIACAVAWLSQIRGSDLTGPVWLAFSRDEELGCLGAPDVVERFLDLGGRASLCVVGEPTQMEVVTAHKGIYQVRTDVSGTEAHSSLAPRAVNAIQAAARLITRLWEMAVQRSQEGPFDYEYDVPHSTVHTGTIHGGTVANIVPKECTFEFEFRYLPQESKNEFLRQVREYAETTIEPEMKEICEDCGFRYTAVADAPGLEPCVDAETLETVLQAAGTRDPRKVAFATDAGHFGHRGIPTIVCGPGNIENAHRPDEDVTREQLASCVSFLDRLSHAMLR
jgi:acetylornithine deacetylase